MENSFSTAEQTEREASPADGERAAENSLDTLLQGDAGLQSQFDQKVSKALNTARNNWEKARAETESQAAERQLTEQEQELKERERALLVRERRAAATVALGQRGLPGELAECLRYEDDESVTQSMDAVERAFSAEVQKAVRERLTGTPPKGGGQPTYTSQMRAALGLKQS